MSAYSTLRITRTRARTEVLKHYAGLTDEQLEMLMDSLLDNHLYNCRIVSDDGENDDAELPLSI